MRLSKNLVTAATLILSTAATLANADSGNTNADDCYGTSCKKIAIIGGTIGGFIGVSLCAVACCNEKIKSFFCSKSSKDTENFNSAPYEQFDQRSMASLV